MTKLYFSEGGWSVPGKQPEGASRIDVPNSPEALAAWLDERQVSPDAFTVAPGGLNRVYPTSEGIEDALADSLANAAARVMEEARERCPKCGDRPPTAAAIVESQDVGAITDWIFDQASAGQVEQVFAALGTRFHELRKVTAE